MAAKRLFWVVVAGTIVGLGLWTVASRSIDVIGWKPAIGGAFAALLIANALDAVHYWNEGRRGLGQWPTPHGRYYNEWLRLPDGAGDYYAWLAARMGDREPWRTWVQYERRLGRESDERA